MTKIDPRLRLSLYVLLAAGGAVLVTYSVITSDLYQAILPVIAGVLMVTGGGVAGANLDVKTRTSSPSILEWARIGQAAVPEILDEVQRARTVQPTPPITSLPVYDGPTTGGDYTGKHRIE